MAEAAACRIHSSLILDFLVVRIDYAVVMAAVVRCTAVIGLALLRGGLLIQLLGDGVERLLHGIGRGLDGLDVIALVLRLQILESCLHGRLLGLGDLVAKLVQGLLRLVDDLIGCVVGVDLILVLLILSGELLGLLDGLVDVLLGEVGGSGD